MSDRAHLLERAVGVLSVPDFDYPDDTMDYTYVEKSGTIYTIGTGSNPCRMCAFVEPLDIVVGLAGVILLLSGVYRLISRETTLLELIIGRGRTEASAPGSTGALKRKSDETRAASHRTRVKPVSQALRKLCSPMRGCSVEVPESSAGRVDAAADPSQAEYQHVAATDHNNGHGYNTDDCREAIEKMPRSQSRAQRDFDQ